MGLIDVTTVSDVKKLAAIEGSNADDRYALAIQLVSALLENLLDRFIKEEAQTEFIDVWPGMQTVFLKGVPVVSVTDVFNDSEREFNAVDEIEADDFAVDLTTGMVAFDRINLIHGPQVLRVRYVGGMATDTAAFQAAFPAVSALAALQVIRITSHIFRGGSQDFETEPGSDNFWGAGIRRALMNYRRWTAG